MREHVTVDLDERKRSDDNGIVITIENVLEFAIKES